MQNPPAVTFATDSEDEEEHDEKARVPQRPSRAHLHVEESQTESEMEDDEHHDASSDGDSDVGGNTNVLEAALKAATTSNVSVTNGTPATRPTFKPISQKRTQANSEKNIAVVNPTANRKRLDTTFARKSATNSTKCKSTLLWPNLDDFFEFILCLSPSQTRLPDKRQRYLRKFKQRGLPAVYDNVNDYCCAQMEAIMEELVASVRSAKELTSYNMRKSLFLTSVSPCSSAHSISDAFPTAQTRLNASAIFSESGFSGTTSGQHDFILTFHANEVKKTANSEFVNGDLLLLRSPPWKNYQLRFFGIVLCNSVVAVGAGGGNPNENEQICVLVRADPATLGDECNLFSTITEMCLSNQKASNWRWSLENVHNITTSAREFQAIKSIPMLPPDITDILVKGSITSGPNTAATDDELTKLSPRLVTELRSKYNVPQLKAIAGAVGEAKHIIIQGPPGTGKTKTILGILSALLDGAALGSAKKRVRIRVGASLQDDRSPAKPKTVAESTIRVLVAAPSNAAVDELLVRLLSEGVFDGTKGSSYRPRIVRVGRPESLQQQQRSQKNEPDNKKIRKKWRKYAHEVEEILLENLVTKHRNAFPSAKIARQEILKNAQIVFCTLSGAGSVAMCDFPQEFDALVVDEAAQAVEASTLIPFKFKPSRVILVGDHRQLPATVISKRLIELRYDRSMFERFVDNKSPVFLLNNQYRMHPEISQFPSRQFYQGKLVQEREIKDWTTRKYHQDPYFKPFLFFDVLGGQQSQVRGSKSLRNLSEVEFVLMLVRTLLTRFSEMEWKKKIGIIAPYKQQIHELGTKLGHLEQQFDRKLEIEINTVDGFQGREKDIIIYSCVRTSGGKRGNNAKLDAFWADVRRMNVAITRAKSSLWIIGNSQLLEQSAAWRALIEDTKSRELYLLDSEFIANNGATIGISTNTIATPATAASGDDRNNNNNTNNKSENNSSNSNSRGKRSGGRRSRKHKKAKKEQNP
ncbi:TPA: hypothetical protein N0F65_004146 [Lagenidium giganteum]|uniref:Uncharacterized protein n=1 Tax=Lagenidium giganteum TaxID=4803 RepID=A0AAV2ZCI5_9STRA|nr:TPA: hypothetical protein N0F65_004146 [Lagenidium giganteum]